MYEIQITYVKVDEKGNDRVAKENLVLEHSGSFSEAETIGYEYGEGLTAFDVVSIKRSKVKEIVNERTSDEERIWLVELQDVFHTEEGEEKYINYKTLVFAKTFEGANLFMSEYVKQGYSMEIVNIKKTNITDVIK